MIYNTISEMHIRIHKLSYFLVNKIELFAVGFIRIS